MKTYLAQFERFSFLMPSTAIEECSQQKAVDEEVAHWQAELDLGLDRNQMIAELKAIGAWSELELKALEPYELEEKIIWLAACNLKEELL